MVPESIVSIAILVIFYLTHGRQRRIAMAQSIGGPLIPCHAVEFRDASHRAESWGTSGGQFGQERAFIRTNQVP